MDISLLSADYTIRQLTPADVDTVYHLCAENTLFYKYHPPFATREDIINDMSALPPGKEMKDKFYLGFFSGDILVAVMDLILNYPEEKTAYIGFFMMKKEMQGCGNGTKLINGCAEFFAQSGFIKIRLAIDKGNPQSEHFWSKNGFTKTGEEYPHDVSAYLPMERELPLRG